MEKRVLMVAWKLIWKEIIFRQAFDVLLLNHRINQIDQIIVFFLKFTNFDYKSLCIHVRLNRDSSNFLSVGSNLCYFKQ